MRDVSLTFIDTGSPELSPLCDTRPACEVRTGALTTRRRFELLLGLRAGVAADEPLARALLEASPDLRVNALDDRAAAHLLLDARLVKLAGADGDRELLLSLDVGQALRCPRTGRVVACCADSRTAAEAIAQRQLPPVDKARDVVERDGRLLGSIWDVLRHRDDAIALDLALLTRSSGAQLLHEAPEGAHLVGEHAVVAPSSTAVYPTAVLDASRGPIALAENVVVRPGAVLCGPCFVGRGSTILDRALVKPNTAVGPVCKIAGEIGGTIVQGFSNKAHEGHLGDSWLGQWVNLGAGTTNSNLRNTYTPVRAPASPTAQERLDTGLLFAGCVLGDFVKTAICTRIMAGTVVGTGAMLASSQPARGAVAPFAWITDDGRQTYELQRFLAAARTMQARRSVTLTKAQEALLKSLHERWTGGGAGL